MAVCCLRFPSSDENRGFHKRLVLKCKPFIVVWKIGIKEQRNSISNIRNISSKDTSRINFSEYDIVLYQSLFMELI